MLPGLQRCLLSRTPFLLTEHGDCVADGQTGRGQILTRTADHCLVVCWGDLQFEDTSGLLRCNICFPSPGQNFSVLTEMKAGNSTWPHKEFIMNNCKVPSGAVNETQRLNIL